MKRELSERVVSTIIEIESSAKAIFISRPAKELFVLRITINIERKYTFIDASSTFRIIFAFISARRYRDCLTVIPISGFTVYSNKCTYDKFTFKSLEQENKWKTIYLNICIFVVI